MAGNGKVVFCYNIMGIIPVSYTHLDVYKRQELYLEKAGLPYKFTVSVILEDDSEEVVLDMSDNAEALTTRYFKIPVNKKIKKVNVNYLGRNGKGEFSAASPALSELKVLSTKDEVTGGKVNLALNKTAYADTTQYGRNVQNMRCV